MPRVTLLGLLLLPTAAFARDVRRQLGMCDASAGIAISVNIAVVANDEDNLLRFFDISKEDQPIVLHDIAPFAIPDHDGQEMDIEGATVIGDTIIWITSHARNKDGKPRPSRHALFATRIANKDGAWTVTGVGAPYVDMVKDLAAHAGYEEFDLAKAATRAPTKKNALNIEGLAATPTGELLIGFRNPVPDEKALIAVLRNPMAVITGAKPEFGPPIRLDLDGVGMRSMEYWPVEDCFLILAGPIKDEADFRLFRWSGDRNDKPKPSPIDFTGFSPEALVIPREEESEDVLILSDDGEVKVGGKECKDLVDDLRKGFRMFRVQP